MHDTIDTERSINHADSEYPALYQLLAGYFHEDWTEEYATPDAAVSAFAGEAPAAAVRAAVDDIDRLLGEPFDDESLERLLVEGFELNYLPERDGGSSRRWLEEVRDRLRGPAGGRDARVGIHH